LLGRVALRLSNNRRLLIVATLLLLGRRSLSKRRCSGLQFDLENLERVWIFGSCGCDTDSISGRKNDLYRVRKRR
jgi:hypothetical protein